MHGGQKVLCDGKAAVLAQNGVHAAERAKRSLLSREFCIKGHRAKVFGTVNPTTEKAAARLDALLDGGAVFKAVFMRRFKIFVDAVCTHTLPPS